MEIKPNIKSKFGPITSRGWNKIAQVVNSIKPSAMSGSVASPRYPNFNQVFVATIGNPTSIGTRKWSYAFTEAYVSSNAITGTALNTVEYNNASSYNGPGFLNSSLNAGFTLQPIRNGVQVIMMKTVDTSGNDLYLFCLSNAIDGTCA